MLTTLLLALALSACGSRSTGAPSASPGDFGAIVTSLQGSGVRVDHVVSGDPGCSDASLIGPAISFDAAGLDQPTPVRIHVYLFGNGSAYDRLRQAVDTCAASYVNDPATYVSLDASPYVLTGQGPWGPDFVAALRTALGRAVSPGG